MNNNATLEKLGQMRLNGFEKAYREIIDNALHEKFTLDELIGHLVDAEFDDKWTKGIIPRSLVFTEKYIDRIHAGKRENYWKSGIGKEQLKNL